MKIKRVDMETSYDIIDSPMGSILIASRDNGLAGLWFEGQKYEGKPQSDWQQRPAEPVVRAAGMQLKQYFAGQREVFDVALNLAGTDFQKLVWKELLKIPSGQTISYGELANRLRKPKAVRAAAAAVGRNPVSVIVPCHRVVGANGALTGYAGGIERKEGLLKLEASTA